MGPSVGYPVAQGERQGLRRRSGFDHAVWRIGRGQFGQLASVVPGNAWAVPPWHLAVRNPERALEPHDGGEGPIGGGIAHRRLQLQRHPAEGLLF